MDDILSRFSINCHSSIRYAGAMTVWFDPFRVADAPCDADVIFVTHDHYDHFSPEDIRRVMKPDAVLVLPETCVAAALRAGFASAQLLPVRPGEAYTVKDLPFTAVPAYNLGKPFHPRGNRWVGYVVTLEGRRVYVAGDTDDTPDARSVSCDVAFLPVGGGHGVGAARRQERRVAPDRPGLRRVVGVAGHVEPQTVHRHHVAHPVVGAGVELFVQIVGRHRLEGHAPYLVPCPGAHRHQLPGGETRIQRCLATALRQHQHGVRLHDAADVVGG